MTLRILRIIYYWIPYCELIRLLKLKLAATDKDIDGKQLDE